MNVLLKEGIIDEKNFFYTFGFFYVPDLYNPSICSI